MAGLASLDIHHAACVLYLKGPFQDDGEGNLQEIRTAIDRFVPIIKAIEVTPGSEQFGRILTIK